ncbi:hypothetical protein [Jannaschia ovalis]|uniref:Lipoprotein n=1 Tax=Jannaschia ovalis TaxID=3038773 RepID=A0ABY8LBU9_9RHOB|nr:hypothetical protein [Jannaschia sp. GRR-S6-38]WGH78769.1 hypothetical protein P8627_00475 [Jannaschia sp. GRR-S6-38]
MGWTGRIAAAAALLALVGCGLGQTRLNPLNWFGRDSSERIEAAAAVPTRPVVDQVVSLSAAPMPGGAIISTVGLPPTQGFWEAQLVRLPTEAPGTLLLEFRILPPIEPKPAGTQPSREVLAGTFISDQDLAGIRTITVQGRQNRRSIRR